VRESRCRRISSVRLIVLLLYVVCLASLRSKISEFSMSVFVRSAIFVYSRKKESSALDRSKSPVQV